jgi:hypothetical protein
MPEITPEARRRSSKIKEAEASLNASIVSIAGSLERIAKVMEAREKRQLKFLDDMRS